jgi:hypothetical protein
MIARLLCIIRGGHKWETVEDPAGSFSRCTRCGTLHHRRTGEGEQALAKGSEEATPEQPL